MYYPITQADIDKAIEKVKQRNLAKQVEIVKKSSSKRKKSKKFYVPKRDNFDKMLDYAIWHDKD